MTAADRPRTADGRLQTAVGDRRSRGRNWGIVLTIVVAALVVVACRSLWLPLVGRYLIVADPLRPADAVVPLGGGRERPIHAASLCRNGYADWFVATNMPLRLPGIRSSYAELVRQEAIWQGVHEDRILIAPDMLQTTHEEALAVRQLVEEQGWRSLIVVTDPFHTRRSRLTFREVFRDTGVTIIVRPVNESWYQADSWWRSVDGLGFTGTEYLSLALYVLGYR